MRSLHVVKVRTYQFYLIIVKWRLWYNRQASFWKTINSQEKISKEIIEMDPKQITRDLAQKISVSSSTICEHLEGNGENLQKGNLSFSWAFAWEPNTTLHRLQQSLASNAKLTFLHLVATSDEKCLHVNRKWKDSDYHKMTNHWRQQNQCSIHRSPCFVHRGGGDGKCRSLRASRT